MSLFERMNINFQFSDQRGTLMQLVNDGYQQINLIESKKGVFRGGHFHKVSKEAFFVINGSVDVTFKLGSETEIVHFVKNDFFFLKPFIIHGMHFPEDCLLLALYDKPVELVDGTKDIYHEEI